MPILFPLLGVMGQQNLGTPSPVGGMLPLPPTRLFISGTTKDSAGVALASCTVKLYRTADDLLMETVVSDGSGAYSFSSVAMGSTYYVIAYKAGSPDTAGTTVNTLVGA